MKPRFRYVAAAAVAAALGLGGCGQVGVEVTPFGNPNRVLTGTVELPAGASLPADTVVVVRVLGVLPGNPQAVTGLLGQQPAPGMQAEQPPQVLGEQTIRNPGPPPVPFRIEYSATDDQLRTGLKLEARVSVGGKVRWFNVNSYSINLDNVGEARSVAVDPAGG
jgi:uncharacterized lipoprotein YbaY